jgi:hypothetical protein
MHALGLLARDRSKGIPSNAGDRRFFNIEFGYPLVVDWPNAFISYLNHSRDQAVARSELWGVRKEFGPLATLLNGAQAMRLKLVNDVVVAYVKGDADLGPYLRRHASLKSLDGQDHLTLAEAKRLLKLNHDRARKVVLERNLAIGLGGRGGPILTPRTSVEMLLQEQADIWTTKQTAAYLGLGRGTIRKLAKEADFDWMRARSLQKSEFSQGRIRSFASKVSSSLDTSQADEEWRTLGECFSTRRCMRVRRVDQVRAVLRGRLKPRGLLPDRPLFQALLFSQKDAQALYAEISAERKDGLSIDETAPNLRVTIRAARQFAQAGVLRTYEVPGVFGKRVRRQEIGRFLRTYISSGEVGRILGTSGTAASRLLITAGLKQRAGPKVDGGSFVLWARHEVEGYFRRQAQGGRSALHCLSDPPDNG